MKRIVAKILVIAMLLSSVTLTPVSSDAARKKAPKLKKASVSVQVRHTKRVGTKYVTSKTKVKIVQSASSKKMVKVTWMKASKKLKLYGLKAGTAVVRVHFKKGKKTTKAKLKVRVYKTAQDDIEEDDDIEYEDDDEDDDEKVPDATSSAGTPGGSTTSPAGAITNPSGGTPGDSTTPPAGTATNLPTGTPGDVTTPPAGTTTNPPTGTPGGSTTPPAGTVTNLPTGTPGGSTTPPAATSLPGSNEDLPVKDIYADYFMVGAAINGSGLDSMALNHAGMTEILKKHFNSTTLSNLMKPSYTLDKTASQNSKDGMPVCKFDTCDPALQFCMENGIKMRGHTLVWHNQAPEWFFYEDYDTNKEIVDAATMDRRMESYIRQVITHCQDNYPGVVYCWDVVNECVCTDENSYIVTTGGWKLRASTKQDNDFTHEDYVKNFWYATMGETYVEKAFAYARKYADKDVKLFYNDYNVFMTDKMNNIYKMVEELKGKGLIDGIGLQPTVLLTWPSLDSNSAGSFKVCLEKYAKLGLELQITELSFKIDEGKVNETTLAQQADRYETFMRLLVQEDTDNGGPCNITSVTVFGICDDYPLYDNFSQNLYLWDKNCEPKKCYYSFIKPGVEMLNKKSEVSG